MFLKINEIPDNYCCIYKLNYPNKKYYIGQTQNLKRRMWEHNNINKAVQPCDLAIAKYGKITEIEILEENLPIDKLNEQEIKGRTRQGPLSVPSQSKGRVGALFFQLHADV